WSQVGSETLGEDSLGGFAEVDVAAGELGDQFFVALFGEIEFSGARRVAVAQAVEAALEAVHAGGVAGGVLGAVVAVVPVEDVERAVGADLQGDGHEPRIIGGEEVGFGLGDVGGAIALEAVHVDAAAV